MGKEKETSTQWKMVQWITRIFVGTVLSVFLLLSPGYTMMKEVKYTLFRYLFGGYGLLLLILLGEGLLTGTISLRALWRKLRPQSPAQYCFIAYFLFTVLSACLSDYPGAVWSGGSRQEGVWTIGLYLMTFYAVAKFSVGERWPVYLLSLTVFLFSLLSAVQLMGYNPLGLYPGSYSYYDGYKAYSGAYIGTIGNVDFSAGFLCMSLGVLWFYVLRGKEKGRYLLLLPFLLGLYVLVRIRVLAGLAGFFGGTAAAFSFGMPLSKRSRTYCFAGIGLLAVSGIAILYFYDTGEGVLHELHLILHGNASDSFGSGRFYIWKNVLERIPEHLLLGTGPDTLAYADIEPFRRFDPELGMELTAYIDAAHSEYLNVLYHQGLLAFLAYVTALGDIFFRWMRRGGRDLWAAVWGAGALCYAVQAAFNISQFLYTPVFWVCLGLLEYSLCNATPSYKKKILKGGKST